MNCVMSYAVGASLIESLPQGTETMWPRFASGSVGGAEAHPNRRTHPFGMERIACRLNAWPELRPFSSGESMGLVGRLLSVDAGFTPIRRAGPSHRCNEAESSSLYATARTFASPSFSASGFPPDALGPATWLLTFYHDEHISVH